MMYVKYIGGLRKIHYIGGMVGAPQNVIEVQADGHELDECFRCGAPNNGQRVQTYNGDVARLIAKNFGKLRKELT